MLFLIPAVGVPNEYLLQDTLKSAIAAFGILLAALAWSWDLRTNPRPLRWHWILFLPLTLCLYALGSMVWSHAYLAAVEAVRWSLVALLMLLLQNCWNASSSQRLLWGIHLGTCVASLWVVLQFWFDFQGFPQAAAPSSTFANRNFFSEYAVSALPFSLLLLANCRSGWGAHGLALSAALIVTSIAMTGTRSALFALWISTTFSLVLLARYRHTLAASTWSRFLCCGVFTSLLVGTAAMGILPSRNAEIGVGRTAADIVKTRSATVVNVAAGQDTSVATRIDMWKSTLRMVLAHPWTGVGAGAFEAQAPRFQPLHEDDEIDAYAHNEYLQLLSEYGLLLGGGLLALLGAYVLYTAQRFAAHSATVRFPIALVATAFSGLVALGLVGLVGFPLHLAPGTVLLAVLLSALTFADPPATARCPDRRNTALITAGLAMGLVLCSVLTAIACLVELQYMRVAVALIHGSTLEASTEKRLQQALSWHPHYKKLQSPIATRLVEMGAWRMATEVMTAMAHSRPYAANTWFSLAVLHARQNHLQQAQTALNRLQQLQPNTLRNLKVQADIWARQGKNEEALQLIDELLAAWPAGLPPDTGLQQMRRHIAQRQTP